MTRYAWLIITALCTPIVLPGCLRNLSQPPTVKHQDFKRDNPANQVISAGDSPYPSIELPKPPILIEKSQTSLVSQTGTFEPPAPQLEAPPKLVIGPRKVLPNGDVGSVFPEMNASPQAAESTKQVKAEKPAKSEPPPDPLLEALRMILNDRHQDALRHLKKYDESTQELFLRLLPPLAMLSRKSLEKLSQQEVAVLNNQLENLLASLRPRTELIVDQMCCCDWIRSYGVYKPVAKDHLFHSGSESRPGELVQVYVELRNLHSVKRGKFYETRLSSEVEIRDASRKICWRHSFNDADQPLQTRTPLHDYFNNYSFYVPASLPPGSYTLFIRVADQTRPEHRRVAEKSIPFRVTGLSMR